jgi:hypothetical protein
MNEGAGRTGRGELIKMKIILVALAFAANCAAASGQTLLGFPFTDETLRYAISLPGGVPLGQGSLQSRKANFEWSYELALEANIPAYVLKDQYTAHSNLDFCSVDFSKQFVHGARKGGEKETIDRSHSSATRVTLNGGGKSEFSVPDCTKDALTFLFYARRELGQGRVPAAQSILFGSLYDASLQYAGAQTIPFGGKPVVTDEIVVTLKGPSSNRQFEIYFARDAARTPLLFKVPLPVGKISMELIR